MHFNLPGSSVSGIFTARILEWVAISYSRGSPWSTSYQYITVVFLAVNMSELECKFVNQWFLGVRGHRHSSEFHKIDHLPAKCTWAQPCGSWWFHNVYGPPEIHSRTSRRVIVLKKITPWRLVVVGPTRLWSNFIFLWVAFTFFWDYIPILTRWFLLRWWVQTLKVLLGTLIKALLPTFQRTVDGCIQIL